MTTTARKAESSPIFGGLYDVPEVARYLKAATHADVIYPLDSAKLIRWIRRGLASPTLTDLAGREILIAFEDLVSLRIIAALRTAGVGWKEIYSTDRWLRETTGHSRPFATEILWTGQGQIFIEWTRRLISGSRHGQMAFDVLMDYLIPIHGLMFNKNTQVASSWEVTQGVVLEPETQFGAPCLKGTRIPTRTLAGMVEAGDSVEWVARAYGILPSEVQAACDWESLIRSN